MESDTKTWVIGGAVVLWSIVLVVERGETAEPVERGECRVSVTADVLNVRAGPSTTTPVVDQLEEGQTVEADRRIERGFRRLGEGRWAAMRYLEQPWLADCAEPPDPTNGAGPGG